MPNNGLITAVYYIGTWLSYIFLAHPAADRLGRRYAALAGMAVLCLGQTLQAAAGGPSALAMILSGRVVSGVGTGIVSTSVPLYQRYTVPPTPFFEWVLTQKQSEVAPPKHRGRFVVMNHVGFVAGLASGFWCVESELDTVWKLKVSQHAQNLTPHQGRIRGHLLE